jgi:hypothetical protein
VTDDRRDFVPPPDPNDPRTPMERMDSFAKRLFAVPKHEIDEQRAKELAAKGNSKPTGTQAVS